MLSHLYVRFLVLVLVFKRMMPGWHDMMMTSMTVKWHDDKEFRRRLTVWYNCSLFQKSCSARDSSYVQCANSRHCVRSDLFCDGRVNCAWPHTALPAGVQQHHKPQQQHQNGKYFNGTELFSFCCYVLCLVLSCSFYKSLLVFVPRNILTFWVLFKCVQ